MKILLIDRITEQPFCQTRVSGSTFVNADCFDVFPFIDDKSIDAIICDLPYGTTNCKWDSVLVEYEQTFPVVLTLKEIKDVAAKEPDGLISSLALLKQSRLSVVPLEKAQWDEVIRLIDEKAASLGEVDAMNKETDHNTKMMKKS